MDRRSATLISIISVLVLVLIFSTSTTAQQAAQKFIGIELAPQTVSPINTGKIGIYGKTDGEGYLQKANGTSCQLCSGGGGGDITAVTAGSGLAGGGTTGDVILSMPSVGTAATYNLGAGSITTDGQGRVSGATSGVSPPTSRTITAGAGLTGGGDLSANRTIAMPNVGTASSCTNCSVTTDAQGRVTASSSGAGGGTLQQAYTASTAPVNVQETTANGTVNFVVPNDDAGTSAVTVQRGACLSQDTVPFNGLNQDAGTRTECPGVVLENTTVPSGAQLYSSPELSLSAKMWDSTLGAVDLRKFTMALQDTEGAGDTLHMNFYHYRHGKWFLPLSLVAQEDFGSTCPGAGCGETILTTPNNSFYIYPGGVLSPAAASLGINDHVIKMRSSPSSLCILTLGPTGQTFSSDGKCAFGSITQRMSRMAVLGWDQNGDTDYGLFVDGTGGPANNSPDNSLGIRLVTDDPATNGNQMRSPSLMFHGDGWNPTVSSHEGVYVHVQNVPVQQTVDAPFNTLKVVGTILGRVSNGVMAIFEQRSLGVVPGSDSLGSFATDMVKIGNRYVSTLVNRPTCAAVEEGLMYYVKGDGAGTRGTLYMCMESDSNTFSWINIKDGGP